MRENLQVRRRRKGDSIKKAKKIIYDDKQKKAN